MITSFEGCVRGIADVIADEGSALDPAAKEDVATFVLETCSRLPDHIRIAVRSATALFDAAPFLTSAKPFHRLDYNRRRKQIARWREARLSPMRSLIAFYASLVIFASESVRADRQSGNRERDPARARSFVA